MSGQEIDPGAFEGLTDAGAAGEGHAAAEGISDEAVEQASDRSITEALWNTTPNPPLDSVESPWDPERGGPARIMRGLQKMMDFDGLPAIADLLIGGAEIVVKLDLESDGDELR